MVNQANDVKVPDSKKAGKDSQDVLPSDNDGKETVRFIGAVSKTIGRITGDGAPPLGLHPIVYFYTRSGTFQPTFFLSIAKLVDSLVAKNQLKVFTQHRRSFEEFLIGRKEYFSLITNKFGSGGRSIPVLQEYFDLALKGIYEGKTAEEIQTSFAKESNFVFLTVPRPARGGRPNPVKGKRSFNRGTRSAAFFEAALPGCTKCGICHGYIHRNSVQIDHIVNKRNGGRADAANAQPSHPYCNSIKDHLGAITYLPVPPVEEGFLEDDGE